MNSACRRAFGSLSIGAVILSSVLLASPSAASADGSPVFPGGLSTPHSSSASQAAAELEKSGHISGAAADRVIAAQPTAVWLGDWYSNSQLRDIVSRVIADARADGKTPVFVTYAIPNRDCGGYSAGGLSASAYDSWTRTLADSLSGQASAVIVEPDALAGLSTCPQDAAARTSLLYNATKALASAGSSVYLDAGHSNWVAPEVMMQRLWNSGLQFARGFSSNVSNFNDTASERSYDEQLRSMSGKHYVIDVSRNGRGATGGWCNPRAAGLGENPRVVADGSGLDALLWVKAPGESDGSCNGDPAAGQWFQSYAETLVRNR